MATLNSPNGAIADMPESLTREQQDLRDRVNAFMQEEVRPLEEPVDANGPIPDEVRRRVRERSRAAGIHGLTQPVEHGGAGAGAVALVVAREAVAAANSRLSGCVFGPGPGVLHAAEGDLRQRYLEPLMRGELRGAWAFTETAPTGDSHRPTWAVREDDTLIVTGRKAYVTGGAQADFFAAVVNVEAAKDAPGGPAVVLIDRDTPGLSIEREFTSLDGSGHVELMLDGARIPAANVVGRVGEGMPRALNTISEERIGSAAHATGLAMWAVRYVTSHVTRPHRSGTPLADRDGVRLRYAAMRVETYAARSTLYRTARLLEAGDPAINEIMAAKVFCTETAGRVVDQAVQLAGGQALVTGHPLERLYREVRSMRLAGGASDILLLNVARGVFEFEAGLL